MLSIDDVDTNLIMDVLGEAISDLEELADLYSKIGFAILVEDLTRIGADLAMARDFFERRVKRGDPHSEDMSEVQWEQRDISERQMGEVLEL